jgi:uracil phosphoribosyltransferase
MNTLTISKHPLVQEALGVLRSADTDGSAFRNAVAGISRILCMEVTAGLPTAPYEVRTPLATAEARRLSATVVLVPVLRAGLGMVEAFLQMLPASHIGHIGLYRDEKTLRPVEYYSKYPDALKDAVVLVLDPMLATGGSADAAIRILKERGARDLRLVCLICAPEGVSRIETAHPDVPIHTAALDRELNERGFIIPGLGDAGDRMFGTE